MKFASKKPPSEQVQGLVQGQGLGQGKTARMMSQKSEHVLPTGDSKGQLVTCPSCLFEPYRQYQGSCGYPLSTHPLNPPYRATLSTYHINPFYQPTLSTPYTHTLSIPLRYINTLSIHSTHPLNPPSQQVGVGVDWTSPSISPQAFMALALALVLALVLLPTGQGNISMIPPYKVNKMDENKHQQITQLHTLSTHTLSTHTISTRTLLTHILLTHILAIYTLRWGWGWGVSSLYDAYQKIHV